MEDCASRTCDNCGISEDAVLKECSRCHLVVYCGKKCQAQHWKSGHKQICVASASRCGEVVEAAAKVSAEDKSVGKMRASQTAGATPVFSGGNKDKKYSVNNLSECANCGSARESLVRCGRCRLVEYCDQACQVQHWRQGGHKEFCVPLEARRREGATTTTRHREEARLAHGGGAKTGDQQCTICLDLIGCSSESTTLSCTHVFHTTCIKRLLEFGVAKVCPVCRGDLESGPDVLYEEGVRRHLIVEGQIQQARQSWNALAPAQQREMNSIKILWQDLANKGHAGAQHALGVIYHRGHGVPKNSKKAMQWFRSAAEQGLAQAQSNLGAIILYGQDVQKNDKEALRWLRSAAEQGFAPAQINLGMLRYGEGVEKNDKEAFHWFCSAAEQGCALAQFYLGTMFYNGEGVEKNDKEALRWFRSAAEQGHAEAQYNLGGMLYNGDGVEKNDREAVQWFRSAAEQGHKRAQTIIGAINYNSEA